MRGLTVEVSVKTVGKLSFWMVAVSSGLLLDQVRELLDPLLIIFENMSKTS